MYKRIATVPFQYDPLLAPAIVIRVRINGGPALPFVVDSGTPVPIIIDQWAVKKLKLPLGKKTRVQITNRPPGTLIATLPRIEFVGSTPKDNINFTSGVSAVMVDYVSSLTGVLTSGPRIAGIIGSAMLSFSPKFAFQFDFPARQMRLCRVPASLDLGPQAAIVPLRFDPANYGYWAALGLPQGQKSDFLLDTGSPFTGLLDLDDPSLATAAKVVVPAEESQIADQSTEAFSFEDYLTLPQVQLGSLTETSVVVRGEFVPLGTTTIGLDLLSRFVATLDLANTRLILEWPPDDARRRPRPGTSGVSLFPQGQEEIAWWVAPGSPADAAGVKPQDVITAVDGHPLNDLSLPVAQHLLDGFAGTKAFLKIQHRGVTTSAQFVRRDLFDGKSDASRGVPLGMADGHLTAEYVTPACLADKLGMQAGDEVTAINGLSVSSLWSGQLVTELNRPQVTLQVQRKGRDLPVAYCLPADQAEIKVAPAPPPGPPPKDYQWLWCPTAGWAAIPKSTAPNIVPPPSRKS